MHRFAVLLMAIAIPLLRLVAAFAQAATPSPLPAAPAPAECRVAPRPVAELRALGATPAPSDLAPWPAAVPSETDLPGGPAADFATAAAVAAVAREYVACVNAWDLTRLLALATDDYVRRFVAAEGPITPQQYAELATPLPAEPAWRATLLEVRDVRVLADDRVGAVVVVAHPRPQEASVTVTLFVFAEVGGHWLLDDAIRVEPADATPAP
jgi:hypothetical protein